MRARKKPGLGPGCGLIVWRSQDDDVIATLKLYDVAIVAAD
jgi:hypothetical protein